MLGELISPLTKGLLLVAFLSTSVAFSTTYLYLGTRDKLIELETQYAQLKQELKECSEGTERIRISGEQDDKITVDKQLKIDSLTEEKDNLLTQLNKIPKKSCKASLQLQNNIGTPNETEYVDIDAPFSPEFTRVLKQLDKDKRSSDITSR